MPFVRPFDRAVRHSRVDTFGTWENYRCIAVGVNMPNEMYTERFRLKFSMIAREPYRSADCGFNERSRWKNRKMENGMENRDSRRNARALSTARLNQLLMI